jgi:hypothetical protein
MIHKPLSVLLLFLIPSCESAGTALIDLALVLATFGLVLATWRLAQHTRALSKLTDRLVTIEIKRDERDAKEKRLNDLAKGISAAEILQRTNPETFAEHLEIPSKFPTEEINAIEVLQSLKRYIGDTESHPNLDYLCNVFDSVRREKSAIRQDKADIAKRVRALQDRIQWFVDEARREISSVQR